MNDHSSSVEPADNRGWWTRDHVLAIVLVAVTALLLVLCWQIVQPFLGAIAWALALAVVAHPLHGWLARRIEKPGLTAGLAVFVIAVAIVTPAIFVGNSIVRETTTGANAIQEGLKDGKWKEQLNRSPRIASAVAALQQHGNLESQIQGAAAQIGKRASQVLAGSAWAFIELLLTLFILFYLFRDRQEALTTLRSLVPLSVRETNEVFGRVTDTIRASVLGTLVVAAVQGALGGLMFWWLGLPAPVLWGAVMALLAIVPVLGAFVVWVPAAIFLAASGHVGKAAILTVWGGVVVALIDNLLYPILVGKKLRLHTVPVFFAIVGGLAVFGAAGLIIGPVILALTDAILEIWRRRTADGKPAEAATAQSRALEPRKETVSAAVQV
jgi:predicted PurR-regulated permease PerM